MPGRINQLTHDGDYTTTSSSISDPEHELVSSHSTPSSSADSWEGLNPGGKFVFTSEELWEEDRVQGYNMTGMLQWEKDAFLRELCIHMPDDAVMPEDHARQIRMAIYFGAQHNRSDWWGWYPLHHAAFKGLTMVCRELVKVGAHVDARNRDGSTALMLAARHGRWAQGGREGGSGWGKGEGEGEREREDSYCERHLRDATLLKRDRGVLGERRLNPKP